MALRGANHVRKRTHDHYLKGSLWCWFCHRQNMEFVPTRQQSTNRHGDVYEYFFCRGKQEKKCRSHHMWIDEIEEAVVAFYQRIQLQPEFVELVRKVIHSVVAEEESSKRSRQKQITRELQQLDKKEENLIDLAADGEVVSSKARDRLRQIARRREQLNNDLTNLAAGLAAGVAFLDESTIFLGSIGEIYAAAPVKQRQLINKALIRRLYVVDGSVIAAIFNDPFADLVTAQEMLSGAPASPDWVQGVSACVNQTDRLALALNQFAEGSSKSVMVGAEGLEPPTCWV
jgi:site-specific DNA recombinase